ncbi:MAG: hypothetical protein GX891_03485 [Clostridiales bacterium]|nr:hypothetical protein [Clostridiales bacterium]
MGTYLISVTAVVCLGVLLDIILPDGQMNKYVRSVFSLIVVLVLIAPLPQLLKKPLNFEIGIDDTIGDVIDDEFADSLNRYALTQKSIELQSVLMSEGIDATISAERKNGELKIYVKINTEVLSGNDRNIILERTLILTERKFGVNRENISVSWSGDGS